MASNISATIKINDSFSGPLSKLQNGLSKSASTMSRFKSALNGGMNTGLPGKMAGGFNNLNGSVSKTGGLFKSMLGANVVGAGITKGVGLITNGVRSMVTELGESSKAWQTFNGNMEMMGKSKSSIAATRGDLQNFAQKTIYSASDMASTYSQLAAVGTKSTGKLVKGFGGLAAASADPQQAMKTLSQQATQAAAKPKIQWMDFKLMLEQTPAGMAAVAKTMHKSTGQLVKDVQAGKVKTQDFFDAIAKTGTNENFSKMATQYKTMGQAMDGMRESLTAKLQPAYDKISKVGIKAISGLSDSMNNVNFNGMADKIIPVVQTIINALKTAGQAIGTFFKSMSDAGAFSAVSSALGAISKAIGSVFSKLSSGGGKDPFAMFKSLGSITGGAISGLAKGIGAISKVIGNLDPTSIKILAAGFVALKASTKGIVFAGIVAGLTALSKLNPGTLNALAKALGVLAIGLLTIKTVGKIDGILSGLGSSIGSLGKGGGLAKAGKSATAASTGFIKLGVSLLLVGAGVALAGAGIYLIASAAIKLAAAGWPAIAMFAAFVVGIVALGVAVAVIGPAMIAGAVGFVLFGAALLLIGVAVFIAAAGMAILATQLPIIATYGASAALNILLLSGAMAVFGIAAIIAAVGLTLLGVGLAIVGVGFIVAAVGALLFGVAMMIVAVGVTIAAVGMIILAVALPLIAVFAMVAAVGMLLLGVALVVVAAVAMIAGLGMMIFALALVIAAPLMIVAAVGALLLGAASIVLGAGLLIVGAGLMVVAAGLRAVISAVSALVSAFVAAVTGLVTAVTSGMSRVVSAVRNGVQNAVNAAKSFAGALVSVGAQLIAGLVRGIVGAVGSAVSAVRGAASKVVAAAKSAFGVHSPSKVFAGIGGYLMAGLSNGITDNVSTAVSSTQSMAHSVIGAAGILNDMSLTSPGDMLTDGFNRAYGAISNVVGAVSSIAGSTLGVNGRVNTATGVPTSDPFTGGTASATGVGNTTTTTNTQQSSNSPINFATGAIQVNSTGNADYDVETIVRGIENYLTGVRERKG